MRTAAIVLAGGASSRFGADKLAALLDGRPVLAQTLDAVTGVASPVVLVLAPGAVVPAVVPDGADASGRSLIIARDPQQFGGPLVGLAAGLAALHEAAPGVEVALVTGGDMPSVVASVLHLLASTLDASMGITTATLEADPPPILPMAVRVEPALAACTAILAGQGKRSLRALLASGPSIVVPASAWRALDPAATTLLDIDTPADLEG